MLLRFLRLAAGDRLHDQPVVADDILRLAGRGQVQPAQPVDMAAAALHQSRRTLIAAELVFGVSSGQGGLGWYIFENRNLLDIPAVFAGLLTVIIIGLIVENLIFRTIERNTVQKWGTQT
jgi:hypothetical protein